MRVHLHIALVWIPQEGVSRPSPFLWTQLLLNKVLMVLTSSSNNPPTPSNQGGFWGRAQPRPVGITEEAPWFALITALPRLLYFPHPLWIPLSLWNLRSLRVCDGWSVYFVLEFSSLGRSVGAAGIEWSSCFIWNKQLRMHPLQITIQHLTII